MMKMEDLKEIKVSKNLIDVYRKHFVRSKTFSYSQIHFLLFFSIADKPDLGL